MRHIGLLQYLKQHFKAKMIVSLSVIIIICSAVTGFISYKVNQNLFENEISQQYLMTSKQTIQQIGYKIQDMYRISDFVFFHTRVEQIVLAMNEVPQIGESEAFRRFKLERDMEEILTPLKNETSQIRGFYIFDRQGNNVYFSQSASTMQITFPEFYDRLHMGTRSSAEIIWQRMDIPDYSEPSGFKSSIVASRLLKSTKQQTIYGMLVLIIDESFFSETLEPLLAERSIGAYIYDQFDQLLYSENTEVEPKSESGLRQDGLSVNEPLLLSDFEEQPIKKTTNGNYLYVKSEYDSKSFKLVSGFSLADIREKSQKVVQLALISGLVSIVLMAVSVSFFSSSMLRPMHTLVQAMKRVRNGNLQVVIPKQSNDEFAFLTDSFNSMIENVQSLIQEVYISRLSEKEAELKALQAQLNPHFLYNALNTIYWRIMYLYDDQETAGLVNSLSDLLKYSLESTSRMGTMEEEFKQIRNYITIQEARYGEQLHVFLYLEEEIRHCRVQRLVIQPLVENVFVHAFRDQTGEKQLNVIAYKCQQDICIDITDNGCGIDPALVEALLGEQCDNELGEERESIGIRNVIRRIQLVHGKPYGLEIESFSGGTTCKVLLPGNCSS